MDDINEKVARFSDTHPEWVIGDDCLLATHTFPNFHSAAAFVQILLLIAERHNHHPEVTISYNNVVIRSTTHDADNRVTEKDLAYAEAAVLAVRQIVTT